MQAPHTTIASPRHEDDDLRGAERRRHTRTSVRLRGWVVSASGELLDIEVTDVSSAGAGFNCAPPLRPGERVRFSIELPGEVDEVWLEATVRWRKGAQGGLRFRTVGRQGRALLERAVKLGVHPSGRP